VIKKERSRASTDSRDEYEEEDDEHDDYDSDTGGLEIIIENNQNETSSQSFKSKKPPIQTETPSSPKLNQNESSPDEPAEPDMSCACNSNYFQIC
jgi:hypothetical protein